jgi:hypothetical protein
MWKRIRHWWAVERDLAQLQGVSDRMLKDMGLERDSLRQRVMGQDVEPPAHRLCPPAAHLARS